MKKPFVEPIKAYNYKNPTKKSPLPKQKYLHEPFQKQLLQTISEKENAKEPILPLAPPLIATPPPYNCPSATAQTEEPRSSHKSPQIPHSTK